MSSESYITGGKHRPPVTDCVEVLKVYDQCITEEVLPRQIDLPAGCPNPLPADATVDCQVVFAPEADVGLPQTRCEVINISEPDEEGFAEITMRQRLVTEITIRSESGETLCGPVTIGPELCYSTVVLYAPSGTFGQCSLINAACSCDIIPDPDNPAQNVLLCTRAVCKEIEIKALVKLYIPTYGFCVPPLCVTKPSPVICPPDNLYPPQKPAPCHGHPGPRDLD